MGNKVGRISIGLSLNNQELTSGLRDSTNQLQSFANNAEQSVIGVGKTMGAQAGASKGAGRLNAAFTQLAFAYDDFQTSLAYGGIKGGIRAAGNNLTAIAAGFGPAAVVATAFGTSLAADLIPALLETNTALTDSVTILDRWRSGLDAGITSIRSMAELRNSIANGDGKNLADEMKKRKERLSVLEEELKYVGQQSNSAKAEANSLEKYHTGWMGKYTAVSRWLEGSIFNLPSKLIPEEYGMKNTQYTDIKSAYDEAVVKQAELLKRGESLLTEQNRLRNEISMLEKATNGGGDGKSLKAAAAVGIAERGSREAFSSVQAVLRQDRPAETKIADATTQTAKNTAAIEKKLGTNQIKVAKF